MAEKRASEWSASFHRLRTETTLFALLFYAFTHASVSLEQVPVLGIKIADGVPKGPLLLFLFLFWVYFAFSWFLRWRTEPIDEIHEILGLEAMQTLIGTLPSRLASPPALDIQTPIHALNTASEQFVETIAKLPPSDTLEKQMRKVSNPPPADDLEATIEHRRSLMLDSYKYFGDKVAEASHDLASKVDSLNQSIEAHVKQLHATEKQLEATKAAIPDSLNAIEKQTRQIWRDLKSVRSEWAIYSVWLGFVVPFGFSLVLVATSIPAFVSEIWPMFTGSETSPCTTSIGWIGWPGQLNEEVPINLKCQEDLFKH